MYFAPVIALFGGKHLVLVINLSNIIAASYHAKTGAPGPAEQ
ncbi:hypothetical protein ACT691_06645 [Vibrio metschnikovii]